MRRNPSFKRGLPLFLLIGGMTAYPLGDWQASALRSLDLSASQAVVSRFPDPSVFQAAALRFPDLSVSQTIALQFLKASAVVEPPNRPGTVAAALPSAAPLVHLIDFQVAATLPPMGHSRFCLRYPDDCKIQGINVRRGNISLTPERWTDLNGVNREVNRRIVAEVTPGNGTTDEWMISPPAGDCKDYAITKRHELLARGWPSRSLLLSEVVLPSGEHHLILVVLVKDAALVLDNLNDDIRLATTTYAGYLWVRIQSPENPKFWLRVQKRDALRTAMLSN